jgi:hypothetical protein
MRIPRAFDIDIRGKEALMKVSETNYQYSRRCSNKYKAIWIREKSRQKTVQELIRRHGTIAQSYADLSMAMRNRQKPIANETSLRGCGVLYHVGGFLFVSAW